MTTPTSHSSQVKVEGDDVVVKAEKKSLEKTKRIKSSVVASANDDKRTFLIIGGGKDSVREKSCLKYVFLRDSIIVS